MYTFVISGIALVMAFIAFVVFRSRGRVKTHTQVSDGDNSSFAHTDSYSSSNNCTSPDASAIDTSPGQENCASADSDSAGNDLSCDNESDSGSDSGDSGDSGSSSSD